MQRYAKPVLVLSAIAVLVFLIVTPRWTVDDAFISYRYGRNLAEHGALVWNPGEDPVEGYTGITLPLISAVLVKTGISVVEGVRVISLLALLGMLAAIWFSLEALAVRPFPRSVVMALAALSPIVYVHAFSGLETMLFASLLSTGAYFYFYLSQKERAPLAYLLFGLVLALSGWTRPEGILFGGLLLAAMLLRADQRAKALLATGVFGAGVLAWWIWRWQYYGHFMPNSFAAKAFPGLINVESLKDAVRFFGLYLAMPLGGAGVLWLVGLGNEHQERPGFAGKAHRDYSRAVLLFAAVMVLTYARSHLFMNYASRLFFPLFPLFLVILGVMLDRGLASLGAEANPRRKRVLHRLLAAAVALQLGVFVFKFRGEFAFLEYYRSIVTEEYLPAAAYLRETLPENARLITYMDAGAIPYYSGLHTTDFGRLNDAFLARTNPDRAAVVDYFFARDADAVVMTSEDRATYRYLDEAHAIREDPRFADYRLVRVFGNSAGFPYFQFVFLHKRHVEQQDAGLSESPNIEYILENQLNPCQNADALQ